MSDVAEESIASGERERMREEDVDDEVSEDEEDDEETAGEEEGRRESTAASLSSLLSSPSTRGTDSVRGGKGPRRQRPVRSHALVELTSLDELSLPTNAARSIKYTCIAASRRLLVLGTSTGSVYVFARFASRQRAAMTAASGGGRLAAVPLHVYTTKDGALHTVRISPSEQLIAVGGESGRVSVLSLAAGVGGVGGGGAAAGGSAAAAASAPSSPASALIHTVPGDARSPDRVNCVCWSSDSSLLYAAHASGLVVQHKVGIRRSVFRSPFEEKLRLEGPAVQMEYAAGATAAAAARLLISTSEASFVYDLHAGKVYQVGKKPRNAPMGACWMRGEGGAATDDFVLAARQNGRVWEASTTGIVYKTHQLRQSASIPTLDPLSFRTADAAAPPSSFLQQAAIDTEAARTTVHLGTLAPITVDSTPPPPPSDALSLPSTSSATTSFASTVSSSVSSSTATVSLEPTKRLVCSAVRSTLFVADIDRSQLVVVSDLGYLIRDWAVCGSDVFVLFAGSGSSFGSGGSGLRKYTLLPVERAAERLLARKAPQQAARLVLSVRPPSESTVDATSPRDTVAAGWPMPLIEKIQTALAALKKKESESLRRQLNDLVCGGDRKPSIGEEEIAVVGESLSSLAVARTRRVSTSDRYLDRRRTEEGKEEEEGAESEYEDGEGGVIRRERGRRKRREEDERSRSSPDSLRPLARPTAASAAKVRAASPRSEGKRVRREELKRAKRLLESDTSNLQTEHRDSLRTLLELGSPPPIQFKHSVTVASVARNLAELARAAPPSITDLLVERRTSVKPSSSTSGKRGGGARVVKAIRPQRPTSGGAGGGSRKAAAAAMEEEERNSNVLLVEGTKKTSGDIVVDEEEDSENNVEWRREKRMGGVFLREEGGALTRANAAAPHEASAAADAAAAAAAELTNQRCERCGLHKSWLAVFLFGVAVHRVSVVVREGAYGRDGVPSTADEWAEALDEVVERTEERRRGCAKCERAMAKALESVPASGRFCDGLRPVATRVDAEAMREKVLTLPEEVLRAAVFGVSTERRKGRRSGEKREENENGGVKQPLSAAAAAPPSTVSGEGSEKENGNGEEKEEREEEGRQWITMMDARQVLTAALFTLGREGLREMITQRAKRRTLESLSDGDWALLARLIAPRENAGTAIPIQMARTMLKEYGMHKFVSIDGPTPTHPSATVATPPPSIRGGGGGYGRRVASIDSPQPTREPATVSWPMDTAGVCPMCSLSLSAVVGGGRATSAAAAAMGGEGSSLACYPCGHAYHAICIGEATRRRHVPGPQGISPVCIVCRVRARRSKAAAAAVAAK